MPEAKPTIPNLKCGHDRCHSIRAVELYDRLWSTEREKYRELVKQGLKDFGRGVLRHVIFLTENYGVVDDEEHLNLVKIHVQTIYIPEDKALELHPTLVQMTHHYNETTEIFNMIILDDAAGTLCARIELLVELTPMQIKAGRESNPNLN